MSKNKRHIAPVHYIIFAVVFVLLDIFWGIVLAVELHESPNMTTTSFWSGPIAMALYGLVGTLVLPFIEPLVNIVNDRSTIRGAGFLYVGMLTYGISIMAIVIMFSQQRNLTGTIIGIIIAHFIAPLSLLLARVDF